MSLGSLFQQVAPLKAKDRCPVFNLHLCRFRSFLYRVFLSWWACLRVNVWLRYPGARPFRHLWTITQSFKSSLSAIGSHLSDFNPALMWFYFWRPRTILAAKFWLELFAFFFFYICFRGVAPYVGTIKQFTENKSIN